MSEGWIKLHRALLDNPIWTCSTPEQKVILITLLSMVNHKPNKWMWKGQKFEVQAGQVITSLDSLTRKSGKGISIRNVRTALKNFENLEFLTNEPTKQGRLLTIVNWGKYQESVNQSDKPTDKALTNDRQTGDKEVTTNKNDKKEKNERMKELFSDFWNLYPKKVGKKEAEKSFMKLDLENDLFVTIKDNLEIQKKSESWQKDKGQYIPNPSTWLNQERWNDEIKPTQQQSQNPFENL